MILGYNEDQIVKMAVSCQSEITDGVVQYNYKTGKLCGASFTTGETENPANPVIEVFWLKQGEDGKIDYDCDECPHNNYDCRISCCIDAYVDNYFDEDFENNFREHVESQIRDVLSDYIGETLSKLNDIRIAISDIIASYDYLSIRQDDWEMRVMDSYVDNALDNGLNITECTPIEYLDAEVVWISGIVDENRSETLNKVGNLVENGDLDGALKLLQ